MDRRKYNSSIINIDENGRKYWIYVDVPSHLLGTEVTEEVFESLEPKKCYLDEPGTWSQEALDKLDDILSIPSRDVLSDTDRAVLEKCLQNIQGR